MGEIETREEGYNSALQDTKEILLSKIEKISGADNQKLMDEAIAEIQSLKKKAQKSI